MSPNSVLQSVIQARSTPSEPRIQPSVVTTHSTPLIDPVFDPDDLDAVLGVFVENAPVAMAMFDRRMRYVLANRQWINDFGLQRTLPLVGRSQFDVFPHLHPGWRNVYDRALQGHVVRSEHDVMAGPGGRTMLFRWEVRPWRKTKDAMVGGLMVTCEKFSSPSGSSSAALSEPSPDAAIESTQAAPALDALMACSLPVLLLDTLGSIQQANPAAVGLFLAQGIEEGKTKLWDMLSHPSASGTLMHHITLGLAKLLAPSEEPTSSVLLPLLATNTSEYQWVMSAGRLPTGEAGALVLAIPAPAPVQPPPAPPPVPTPVVMIPDAAAQLAQRRLEEQLSITQAEMRGLHDQEAAYRRRELRQREVLDGMPCGMIVLDERGRPSFNNAHTRDLFGRELKPGDSIEDWLLQACHDDKHREEVAKLWRESVWRRQLTKVVSLSTADGLLKDFEFRPSPLPGGGLLVTIHDVTETCRLEEMLRSTEAKFRALLHENPLPTVLTDQAGAIFEVNTAAEKLFGHPKAELRRLRIDDWLLPESVEARRTALQTAITAGQPSASLSVILKPSSNRKTVAAQLRIATVFDSDGRLHSTAHYFEVERPVAASFAPPALPTTSVAAASHVTAPQHVLRWQPLLTTDTQGRIIDWSEAAVQTFGFDAPEILGHRLHTLFRPSDPSAFYADLEAQMASPGTAFTWAWFGKSSTRGHLSLLAQADELGGLAVQLLAAADAPERVALTPSAPRPWPVADLGREQLLLTEAHHRIKNHLQIISSLLNFHSNAIEDPGARNALRSSQTRVQAIGELHQLLFQLSAGQALSFQDFADDLVARLRHCYDVAADRVVATVQLDDCPVLEEWLVPLALILNESVANAFKHAFPNDRKGRLEIRLQREGDHASLTVRDDGIGLPPDFPANPGSGLGHKILQVFADQMGATLTLQPRPSEGALFHLRFPIRCVDN